MPTSSPHEYVHLNTEDQAWELLKELLAGKKKFDALPQLTFGEWAKVDVYIPGTTYNSSLTPYMMKGWVDLQRSVYRTYSVALSGVPDGKKLTNKEKEELELVVKVEGGSSDQSVDLQSLLETISAAMVDKMEPTHILIVAVTVILTMGGASVLKTWLSGRKEVKLAEIEQIKSKATSDAHIAALTTIAEVAGVDRERAKLIVRAAETVPILDAIGSEAERGREALVKHMTKVDAKVNGVDIKSEAGQSITSRTRIESDDVRLDGLYKIRKVDTTVATGFRVHLIDVLGQELVGDVAEVMTTLEDRDVIRDAEWSKVPVFLQINAKKRRDEYVDATIIRARKYDPETDDHWPT